MEITRTSILREVLTDKEEQMFKYSKFRAGLTPLEGYEQIFADLRKTCDLLREMLREQLAGPQKPLADWQKELMDGKQPDMSWDMEMVGGERDGGKKQAGAEPIRRMMVNGTTEPVVYPGGE